MSKITQETIADQTKQSNLHFENESDFDEDFEFENEKEKIVENCPSGRFIRFNEELGTGAYKRVYRAYDNDSGCEVAWNVIRLQRLPQKERKRISEEVHLLKSLKHANFINFISAWINRRKEEVVFITEIVTGGSLKSYLKKIKNPKLKVVKGWCREILQGLDYLHSMKPNPIIHRDLKCENIFINGNKGEIKIGDLGLATCMSASFAKSVLGTPHFMAPEMYEEAYGTGVDIYSFGMCLIEMVTQEIPYQECENAGQIYKKVLTGKKPQSLELIVNEKLKTFILDCLKDQEERPSAKDLLLSKDDEGDNCRVSFLIQAPNTSVKEENCCVDDSISTDFELFAGNNTMNRDKQSEDSTLNPSRENPNKFTYEFSITAMIQTQIYVNVKIESQELQYFKQKIIQLNQNTFTLEALFSEIKKTLESQIISTALFEAIAKFVENVESTVPETCSEYQNRSNFTANTSFSTAAPINITKYNDTLNNLSAERGMSTSPKPESPVSYFQASTFISCYNQYLSLMPREYSSLETEELMNSRHSAELCELKKAHAVQKKVLLVQQKESITHLQIPSLCEFNPNELDETPKDRTHHEADQMPFSPISSDFNSSDETPLNEEHFTSHNNSVEMSLVKKLNLQRHDLCDELNKSTLTLNAGENTQKYSELSNTLPQFPAHSNPITPSNVENSQLHEGYINDIGRQDHSIASFFSPIHKQASQTQLTTTISFSQSQVSNQTLDKKQELALPQSQISVKPCETFDADKKETGRRGHSVTQVVEPKANLQRFNSVMTKKTIWVDMSQKKCSSHLKKLTSGQSKKGIEYEQNVSFGTDGAMGDKLQLFVINSLSPQEERSHDSPLILTNDRVSAKRFQNEIILHEEIFRMKDQSQCAINPFEIEFSSQANFEAKNEQILSEMQIERIRQYVIQTNLRREAHDLNKEDVKIVQTCLGVISDRMLETNGHFGHYTEKAVKNYQQKLGMIADGSITQELWGLMKEDFEKKLMTPFQAKELELRELSSKVLEDKKFFKEKQLKDAQACLQKIQRELIDLSTL